MQAMKDTADRGEMAYDQMIGEGNPEGNALVQAAIDALLDQTRTIERIVGALDLGPLELEGSDSLDDPRGRVPVRASAGGDAGMPLAGDARAADRPARGRPTLPSAVAAAMTPEQRAAILAPTTTSPRPSAGRRCRAARRPTAPPSAATRSRSPRPICRSRSGPTSSSATACFAAAG